MIHAIRDNIQERGGVVKTKSAVQQFVKEEEGYLVNTSNKSFRTRAVLSNIPVWNMAELTSHAMKEYFNRQEKNYEQAWGAFTMGIVTEDCYPDKLPLHHQLHLDNSRELEEICSGSVFVSFSHPEDKQRANEGERVLNISTHTDLSTGLRKMRRPMKNSVIV